MTEKVPCPVCERPMKPRHTKGTDFMPRHNNPQGDRCSGTTAVVNAKPECEDCGQATCHKAPVSEPAPTVESRDDAEETTVNDTDQAKLDDAFGTDYDSAGTPEVEYDQRYGTLEIAEERVEGPWLGADEPGTCGTCDDQFAEGDSVRWDGLGAWQCRSCEDERLAGAGTLYFPGALDLVRADTEEVTPLRELLAESLRDVRSAVMPRIVTGPEADRFLGLPTADEFMDPAEPPVKLNVSGQPKARRDWQKRYILVDPDLGDFRRTKCKERKPKGITRATTFNKAAQNTTSLNAWGKRNVVMGASLRPDILRRAHGLNHDNGKDELNRIVDELETAAGAKVSADEGTFLHKFCDLVDAGLKTWKDAPVAYQQDIKRYVEALAEEGLEPVPGLIERTTFIREYGGVAGTFDRVFYHRPSGQYIVGDLKTGKTMKYAMDETECQIFTYAHGVNQNGIYDWNTDTWEEPHTQEDVNVRLEVSEKVGVIVHMPVQGPEAGEVYLRFADLECGRAYADLNHAVRSYPKSKVRPFALAPAEPPVAPTAVAQEPLHDIGGGLVVRHTLAMPVERDWESEFRAVTTKEAANTLWRQARASGLGPGALRLLVDIGKDSLTRLATQPDSD